MGVVYKLKDEIRDFIVEKKRSNQVLSCRRMSLLIEEKFKSRISKSSINAIMKEAGLSMPVGRRLKKRRRGQQVPPNLIEFKPIDVPSEIKEAISPLKPITVQSNITPPSEPVIPLPVVPSAPEPIVEQPVATPEPEHIAEQPVTPSQPEPAIEQPAVIPPPEPIITPPAEVPPPQPIVEQPVVEQPVIEQPVPAAPTPVAAPTPIEEPVVAHIEPPSETECTGAILLKATDYLIKGSFNIAEAVKGRLSKQEGDLLTKTESLIYLSLFEKDLPGLWAFIDRQLSAEGITTYLNELQSVSALNSNILRAISSALQEVRCIKANCLGGDIFYLDGQMHTVWSTQYIPYDFSATIYDTKSCINRYFFGSDPFVLFVAPGYDIPTREFFNFILSLASKEKTIANLTLYNNKLEELEVVHLGQPKKRYFICGFYPWQYVEYRKVYKIGEFRPFYAEALHKDIYGADIEIELSQTVGIQHVMLRGCALKMTPDEKTRLVVLSNFAYGEIKPEDLANTYLNHWPNLEECFQDFSRKIELFTYTAASRRFFSPDFLNFDSGSSQDIKTLFNNYLKALDLYIRWHFLPLGYEDSDFSTVNERFYSLKVRLKREKGYCLAIFQPPSGYAYLKELEYACRRVNEKEIIDLHGKKLQFSVASQ
ncbi:MAG: hypothetical protein WC723_02840 [Candidatus Omnitrophota bacterium]